MRRGFSSIEVIVAATLFSLMVFVVASVRGNVATLSNLVNQRLQSRQDIDRAVEQLVTDVRSASRSSQGAYPIEQATTSSLVVFSDVDGDGVFERVRYAVQGSDLVRGVTEPSGDPLAYSTSSERVATAIGNLASSTSAIFQYYGAGYTGTQAPLSATGTLPSDVRVVRVTLLVDVKPREAPRSAYVSQLITVRNLR